MGSESQWHKWYGRSNWLNGNDISCAAISSPRPLHATLCPRSLKDGPRHSASKCPPTLLTIRQLGVDRRYRGRGQAFFLRAFLRAFGVDARRWLRWILNSPRRSFKLRVLVDRQ